MFKLEFDTEGADFIDEEGYDNNFFLVEECKRILKKVCQKLEDDETSGSIIDINGNKIGSWELD